MNGTDRTNPGAAAKAPIERLLEMMDRSMAEQAKNAEIRAQQQAEHIHRLEGLILGQGQKFEQLQARFDSVNGKIGIDERLRQIEVDSKSNAKKADLAPISQTLHTLDLRVKELEDFEEERKKAREELGKEVRSSVVKWAVPIMLGALMVGLFVLATVQFFALRAHLPTP